jgi:ribose transport system ATP-binding protein
MVGRRLDTLFPERASVADSSEDPAEVRLAVRGAGNGRLHDIRFDLAAGEIVGVAGLQGSGRSALARAICGAQPFNTGTIELDGRAVRIRSPRAAVRNGIGYVTEDRKGEGLALRQSVRDNALLVRRAAFGSRAGALGRTNQGQSNQSGTNQDRFDLGRLLRSVTLVARAPDQDVRFLSGGNQQKVVLAKWLAVRPSVLVVDEPTRGIDVGAKHAVYELLRGLARDGMAILMISSELPELIGMSDRVLVMRNGRIAGELPPGPSEEAVIALATGHEPGEAR